MFRSYKNCDIEYLSRIVESATGKPAPMHELFMHVWNTTKGEFPRLILDSRSISFIQGEIEDRTYEVEKNDSTYVGCIDHEQALIACESLRQTKWGHPEDFYMEYAFELWSNHSLHFAIELYPSLVYPKNKHYLCLNRMMIETKDSKHYSWHSIYEEKETFEEDYSTCFFIDISIAELLHPKADWSQTIASLDMDNIAYDFEGRLTESEDEKASTLKKTLTPERRRLFLEGWLYGKGLDTTHHFEDKTRSQIWDELGNANPQLFPPASKQLQAQLFDGFEGISFRKGRPKSN